MQKKFLKRLVLFFLLLIFMGGVFYWGYLLDYYIANNPTEPQSSEGKIYPLNNHGKIVYLDWNEQVTITAIPILLFLTLFFGLGYKVYNGIRTSGKSVTWDNILLELAKLRRK